MNDPCLEVNLCGIAILHELAKILANEDSLKLLFNIFNKLLNNTQNLKLIAQIVKYLPENLNAFIKFSENNNSQVLFSKFS